MNGRPLSQRFDPIRPGPECDLLTQLPDELHDIRRVQDYGQEEDLKEALGKMILRVEELSTMLTQALRTQTELETSLKLARSNMQLALANNEMLEEALRRESASGSKDVGWRRRSDRPESRQGLNIKELSDTTRPSSRQGSLSITSTPNSEITSASEPASPDIKPISSPPPPQSAPAAPQDSRFFRFRFGSSAATSPNPNTSNAKAGPSRPRTPSGKKQADFLRDRERDAAHLTSASLPSLVSDSSRREAELAAELEAERAARIKATTEKTALEQEVESLSQALFEEANKMVAEERIRAAEILEELRQVRAEKEALRSAMQIIELENSRLKSPISEPPITLSSVNDKPADDITPIRTRPSSMIRVRSRSRSVEDIASVSKSGKTRSDSPSSVVAFRHRSSSSEHDWTSSPPSTSHGDDAMSSSEIAASDTYSNHNAKQEEHSENGEALGSSDNEDDNHKVKAEMETKTTLQTSKSSLKPSYSTVPIEESPWTRI